MRRLQIIIGSTRPGRVGWPVAEWINGVAQKHEAFDDVQVVDLAEWNPPFIDEPHHPRLRRCEHQHTRDWSATIDQADAFIIVLPEYNYGFTAPLENAIDYLQHEWAYKPVGLVSYGGVAAAARAAHIIKQVLTTLKMMPLPEAAQIQFVAQFLDEDRAVRPNTFMEAASLAMLDELARWSDALAPLREQSHTREHAA